MYATLDEHVPQGNSLMYIEGTDILTSKDYKEDKIEEEFIVMGPGNGYQLVNICDKPSSGLFALLPIYKDSVGGGKLIWQIGFQASGYDINVTKRGDIIMLHGHVETCDGSRGVITQDRTAFSVRQDESLLDKVWINICKRFKDKFTIEGYRPEDDVTPVQSKPMKGVVYQPGEKLVFPLGVEPKIDGIRMRIRLHSESVYCRSNNNIQYKHLKYIQEDIKGLFAYLPPSTEIDGELYIHEIPINGQMQRIPFEVVTSIVRTVKTEHPLLTYLEYHIFDIIYAENPGYAIRYTNMYNAYNAYLEERKSRGIEYTRIKLIPCLQVNNKQSMEEYMTTCIALGYEGIIIRKLVNGDPGSKFEKQASHKPGRSKGFLKWKLEADEEGRIIDVEEAVGTEQGAAIFIVEDKRGNRFGVRMNGSIERRRRWLQEREYLIGKQITYKYQNLTNEGLPRFPVGKEIRDYE